MSIETKTGLSIALLLAKRTQEIRFMEWEHIDFDRAIWTTPAIK
jgi:integrase